MRLEDVGDELQWKGWTADWNQKERGKKVHVKIRAFTGRWVMVFGWVKTETVEAELMKAPLKTWRKKGWIVPTEDMNGSKDGGDED